jgi:hypothetical protein
MERSPDIRFEGILNVLLCDGQITPLGIEMATAPTLGFGMFGMLRIGEDGEELLISGNTADILGWSGASAADTACMFRGFVESEEFFDFDRVTPIIAEVINIREHHPGFPEVAKANFTL